MLRFIRTKRFVRILLRLAITLLTVMVLLYVYTNWSGRRRWAATRDMVEREGETLEFRKLLPETPPEAKNLLAIEPLRGIAIVVENDVQKGEPGAKRKALEGMKWSGSAAPAATGVSLGKDTDIQEWVKYLGDAKYLELPAGPTATGRDLLTALDAKFPLLKQIADETANRPLTMLTPGLREREMPELLFSMRVPYLTSVQSMGRALGLRARAAVAAGAGAEAARSIVAIHRLALGCEQELFLIGFLVGNSMEMMALEPLWLGLRERVFAEEDLLLLQNAFAVDHSTGALLQAMRGELAAGLNAVESLQLAASGQRDVNADLISAFSSNGQAVSKYFWRLLPSGLFDHWKSVLVEQELRHLIQPLKSGGLRESVLKGEAVGKELTQHSSMLLHPDYLIARLMLPAITTVSSSALAQDTRRQQALTALALERFYLKHARYPAMLAELTPEFLPAIPNDPCDGKPLRYRTTPEGRYRLWSVGFDGKDDDGKVTVDAKSTSKLNKLPYVGDWTWQYEPVK